MAGGKSGVCVNRRRGNSKLLLSYKLLRVRFDSANQSLASRGIHGRRKLRTPAEAGEGRHDHQVVEVFKHVAPGLRLPAPPSGYGRHQQFLSKQMAAESAAGTP